MVEVLLLLLSRWAPSEETLGFKHTFWEKTPPEDHNEPLIWKNWWKNLQWQEELLPSRRAGHVIPQDLCYALYQPSQKGKLGRNTILDQSSMSYKGSSLCLLSNWFTGSGSTDLKWLENSFWILPLGKCFVPQPYSVWALITDQIARW